MTTDHPPPSHTTTTTTKLTLPHKKQNMTLPSTKIKISEYAPFSPSKRFSNIFTPCSSSLPVHKLKGALSKENPKKLLEQSKSGFKITAKLNKYRSQMTIQPENSNLNYLIDLAFTKVNRLFVLSFERIEENNVKKDHRYFFSHYYVPNDEIKDFNVLIDGRSYFDLPVKNKEQAYEKIIKISSNNDCTTGNYMDFTYFKGHYRLTANDLSKQRPTTKLFYWKT